LSIITVSVKDLRPHLSGVLKDISSNFDRYIITRHGKPEAIMMSVEDYESIIDTMNIQADRETMRRIRQAERDLKKGKGRDLDIVKKELGLV